jgi:hypothetical protein
MRTESRREPEMSSYLIISFTPPAREGRDPLWWVDIGHVEILSWAPPNPPEAHAFTVEPTSHWRMFLSAFWPQRARIIRIRGFPGRSSYWKIWPVLPSAAGSVADYLEDLRLRSRRGDVRYRAFSFNCFHVAHRCLMLAGIDPQPGLGRWRLLVPTLWARSFRNFLTRGMESRSMNDHLGPGRRQLNRGLETCA